MITETYVMLAIMLFVVTAYSIGTWATNRAIDSVREMDAQDNAESRYAEMVRKLKEATK